MGRAGGWILFSTLAVLLVSCANSAVAPSPSEEPASDASETIVF